jgi:formyltetrahydrofolate deformylase
MNGYDAASYSFYEGSDYSFYGDAQQIVLAAIAQPRPGEPDLHIGALVGADPGALVSHAASRSIAWRARMSQARFEEVRQALHECRAPLIATRAIAAQSPALKIALFVTQQEESPKAVLDWCRSNPDKARVCGMFSTNAALEPLAEAYGVPFFVGGEQRLHAPDFFDSVGIAPDLIVLARYMRILPPDRVARFPHRIINVHHALLPAFIGANTYERALERGVRVMGATAHYVTDALDEGPIICQQAFAVDPAQSLAALKSHGAQFEAAALRNAVAAHVEHRLLPIGSHVVRFECPIAERQP